jgi:two-component system, response regulator / RNA-binding antiterminator
MTANRISSVTIVGEDGDRNAELATLLETQFDISLKPICRETFDSTAGDNTDIVLVFDEPTTLDLVSWIGDLYSRRALPIVFFSETDGKQRIHDAITAGVSSYIYDGYRATRVPAIIETVVARFEQRRLLEEELATARQDLDDRKIIDRAKGLIMSQRGCSEEEAYASLRRRAMDSNRKISDFANDVLMVSEVLKGK